MGHGLYGIWVMGYTGNGFLAIRDPETGRLIREK